MASVTLRKIDKQYPNGFHAVKSIDLDIQDKEFMVLVGPSGCGKSTTLRMIAGLEEISGGELLIGESIMNKVAPKDRDIAMVFQNYALYPHMTVADNMAFGLQLRKTPKNEIKERIDKAAHILGIENLLDRKPKQLSGGQRQRVALGRAIVRKPKVFLMDEPLSNLDAKLRVQMRAELIKLHQDLQTTFIYVTHDQTEAMTMGSRICVMNAGSIYQVADPKTIYQHPANLFVAGFIGMPQMNLLEGVLAEDERGFLIKIEERSMHLPLSQEHIAKLRPYFDRKVILGIRPEHIHVVDGEGGEAGKVMFMELLGSESNVHFSLFGKQLVLKEDFEKEYGMGDLIKVSFDHEKVHFFDKETEQSIL